MRNKEDSMSQIDKKSIQKEFQRHEKDTGSSDVQIAVLTKKIEKLSEHLKSNKKDHSSRFGLIKMVNARRSLLDYLKRTDLDRYHELVKVHKLRR
jgi:small subunit ribosomal protein S15